MSAEPKHTVILRIYPSNADRRTNGTQTFEQFIANDGSQIAFGTLALTDPKVGEFRLTGMARDAAGCYSLYERVKVLP